MAEERIHPPSPSPRPLLHRPPLTATLVARSLAWFPHRSERPSRRRPWPPASKMARAGRRRLPLCAAATARGCWGAPVAAAVCHLAPSRPPAPCPALSSSVRARCGAAVTVSGGRAVAGGLGLRTWPERRVAGGARRKKTRPGADTDAAAPAARRFRRCTSRGGRGSASLLPRTRRARRVQRALEGAVVLLADAQAGQLRTALTTLLRVSGRCGSGPRPSATSRAALAGAGLEDKCRWWLWRCGPSSSRSESFPVALCEASVGLVVCLALAVQ